MLLLADQANFSVQEGLGVCLAAAFGVAFFWAWARVRKAEREALCKAEQVNRIFDDSSIGMAVVSLSGDWLRVNKALQEILGYSDLETLGMTWMDFTHPEDVTADQALVARCLSGEILTYKMAKRYVHKDGHTVYAILTVSVVRDDAGKPHFFQSQVQDVSRFVGHHSEAPCPQGNQTCALREYADARALVIQFPMVLEAA